MVPHEKQGRLQKCLAGDPTMKTECPTDDLFPETQNTLNTKLSKKEKRHKPDQTNFDRDVLLLSKQPPVQFEHHLKKVVEQYGMRTSKVEQIVKKIRTQADRSKGGVFEAPEPWPEAVDGRILIKDIRQTLLRYCILPEGADLIIGLWVLFAHAHDAFQISPILAIQSPEKRCGKTTLLEVISMLVPKPLTASNITPAALFRAMDKYSPTLLLDEADTFLHGNDELRGAVNSGQRRRTAKILRCVGDDAEPTEFSVWGPKVIAGIGTFPDTIQDRAIVVRMRRKAASETVNRFREREKVQIDPLLRMAARWAHDNLNSLSDADPTLPMELNDRAQDNAFGLLAIADRIDEQTGVDTRETLVAMKHFADARAELPPHTQLLKDIREIFIDTPKTDFTSRELIAILCKIEESHWSTWQGNRPISPKSLAGILREFDVHIHKTKTARIYRVADFRESFASYLDNA